MKTFIIGIDPGKNGGIVSLTNGKLTTVDAMPSSIEAIWDHFIYLGFPNLIRKESTYVFIEQVHSMPTDGRRAAFSFGYHLGVLDTVLDRMDIKPIRIAPAKWMAHFGLQKAKEESKYNYKKRLLDISRSKYNLDNIKQRSSKSNLQLTLKTCDAAMIALYGFQTIINGMKEST